MTARQRIIPVFVPHMGCPQSCVFCDQQRISGKKTATDEVSVADTIRGALTKLPAGAEAQLAYYGGSFTAIPVYEQIRLLDAALPFLHSGEISSIRVSTRPDAVDESRLNLLRKYGVKVIELGAQSMCDEVLISSQRGHKSEDIDRASELVKACGFKLVLQMMTGLPGDTKKRTMETARHIISLSPDAVRIYPTVIIKGTMLYEMWKKGHYREHTVEEAVDWCADIIPMFNKAKIPIIRLGLNPTDDLSGGEAVAGAYHPAFGELAYSRVLLNRARALLEGKSGGDVIIGVNSSDISKMLGQHRQNAEVLTRDFELRSIKVVAADIPKGLIALL